MHQVVSFQFYYFLTFPYLLYRYFISYIRSLFLPKQEGKVLSIQVHAHFVAFNFHVNTVDVTIYHVLGGRQQEDKEKIICVWMWMTLWYQNWCWTLELGKLPFAASFLPPFEDKSAKMIIFLIKSPAKWYTHCFDLILAILFVYTSMRCNI